MATVYVNSNATGTPDGLTPATGYLHPDDIPAVSLSAGSIVEFVAGSGPYVQTADFGGKGSGASGNPVIWRGNFCEWTGGLNLNSVSGGEWHLSASGTNEYYFTGASGANPSLATPSCGTVNGHYAETQAEEAQYQMGNAFGGTNHSINLGTLPDGRLGFGDNDSLGFSTVYVRLDDLSHATAEIIVSQITSVFSTNFTYQQLEDFIFSYADEAVEPRSAVASKWTVKRCIMKYMGWQGVNISTDNSVDIISCLGFFAGHRFYYVGGSADLAVMGVYNNLAIKSHLFGFITRWSTQTHPIKGNVGYGLSAGVLDTVNGGASLATINEDYNIWYVDFTGGASSIDYPSGASTVWTATGANSFPASTDTNTSTLAGLVAGGLIIPSFNTSLSDLDSITNSDLINLILTNDEYIGESTKWWTGPNPWGINGEPYSDIDTDFGPNQSTLSPFHPVNL